MERLALDRWASPWLRNQHVARYAWAGRWAGGARVLDAACGTAYGSRALSEAGARSVTSVDLSFEAFEAARRVAGASPLALVGGDAQALPFQADSFDLYTSFETIEHVRGDERLVHEARRVLSAGGAFVCSTPNRELLSPGNTIADRPANPYHVREYGIAEFRTLLERAFDDVELFGQTWFSRAHKDRLARVGAWGNMAAVRLHQLRNVAGLPWESRARHEPAPLDDRRNDIPEVVIAVCRVS